MHHRSKAVLDLTGGTITRYTPEGQKSNKNSRLISRIFSYMSLLNPFFLQKTHSQLPKAERPHGAAVWMKFSRILTSNFWKNSYHTAQNKRKMLTRENYKTYGNWVFGYNTKMQNLLALTGTQIQKFPNAGHFLWKQQANAVIQTLAVGSRHKDGKDVHLLSHDRSQLSHTALWSQGHLCTETARCTGALLASFCQRQKQSGTEWRPNIF